MVLAARLGSDLPHEVRSMIQVIHCVVVGSLLLTFLSYARALLSARPWINMGMIGQLVMQVCFATISLAILLLPFIEVHPTQTSLMSDSEFRLAIPFFTIVGALFAALAVWHVRGSSPTAEPGALYSRALLQHAQHRWERNESVYSIAVPVGALIAAATPLIVGFIGIRLGWMPRQYIFLSVPIVCGLSSIQSVLWLWIYERSLRR